MSQAQWLTEELGEGICQLTLSNAPQRNALTPALLKALKQTMEGREEVRAWLIRGEGHKAFSSGYNIEKLGHYAEGEPLPDEQVHEALCALEAHPAPSVALLHGCAFGAGLELAMAADFRVADETAVLCMPPARLGLIYPLSGIRRMSNLIGPGRARWMFLTGEKLAAPQALEWGLLNVLKAGAEEAEACARALCKNLAAAAPLAIRGMRASMRAFTALQGAENSATLREARRQAYNSEDTREGRAAFLEKRAPKFRGR